MIMEYPFGFLVESFSLCELSLYGKELEIGKTSISLS